MYNTVAGWFHSKHSMLLNDLSLPSDLKERRAGERNLSLPPIGCKRKVQATAMLLWGAAEKERYSRVCIHIDFASLLFPKSTSCANIWPRCSRGYKGAK